MDNKEEIDAEMFKVIRANQEKTTKALLKVIHKHFKDETEEEVSKSLSRLTERLK